MILDKWKLSLMGTAIAGIRQMGDLHGSDRNKVLEMYRKISKAKTPLPPAIAFVFDRECMTQQQKDDWEGLPQIQVRVLPRRMFGSYLLDPDAVAAVMSDIRVFASSQLHARKF